MKRRRQARFFRFFVFFVFLRYVSPTAIFCTFWTLLSFFNKIYFCFADSFIFTFLALFSSFFIACQDTHGVSFFFFQLLSKNVFKMVQKSLKNQFCKGIVFSAVLSTFSDMFFHLYSNLRSYPGGSYYFIIFPLQKRLHFFHFFYF